MIWFYKDGSRHKYIFHPKKITLVLVLLSLNKAVKRNLTSFICIKFRIGKMKWDYRELVVFIHYGKKEEDKKIRFKSIFQKLLSVLSVL